MSLKEITKEKHAAAESTLFMKAVFKKSLPQELWIDWTKQKSYFYNKIEYYSGQLGLLDDISNIRRSYFLLQDYTIMNNSSGLIHNLRKPVLAYGDYIDVIGTDADKILAHLYTWHMGDMFGGQMIKKVVPGSHLALEFENVPALMQALRSKLHDGLGPEANTAFDWAINMMKDYDGDLEQNRIACQTF